MSTQLTNKKAAQLARPIAIIAIAVVISVGITFALRYRQYVDSLSKDIATAAQADLDRRGYRPLSSGLRELLDDPQFRPVATQTHPLLGQRAPDFTLASVDGEVWHLNDELKQGPVLLVFYYGYHCDHCVSQLFGLNKDYAKFVELGARVVAVSPDSLETTRDRYRQYGKFAFPVLADIGNQVARDYSVVVPAQSKNEPDDLLHGTFVINQAGLIVWANRGDGPFTDNRTLLKELNNVRGTSK